MYDIIFVIAIIGTFYCDKVAISVWIFAIWALKTSVDKKEDLALLEIIEDYPKEDCITPVKFKFLFKKLDKSLRKSIPKEMYWSKVIKFIGLLIYTLVGVTTFLFSEELSVIVGCVYFLITYGMDIVFFIVAKRKSFLRRYKKLNIYNFMYLFNGANEPYPRMRGKCKIVSEYKRRKYKYVTVMMLDTKEVKENILFPGNKRQGEEPVYSLYEICKVFYII